MIFDVIDFRWTYGRLLIVTEIEWQYGAVSLCECLNRSLPVGQVESDALNVLFVSV